MGVSKGGVATDVRVDGWYMCAARVRYCQYEPPRLIELIGCESDAVVRHAEFNLITGGLNIRATISVQENAACVLHTGAALWHTYAVYAKPHTAVQTPAMIIPDFPIANKSATFAPNPPLPALLSVALPPFTTLFPVSLAIARRATKAGILGAIRLTGRTNALRCNRGLELPTRVLKKRAAFPVQPVLVPTNNWRRW